MNHLSSEAQCSTELLEIVIIVALRLETIFQAEQALISGKTIILNTSQLRPDQAKRFVDILTRDAIRVKPNTQIITIKENIILFKDSGSAGC